MKIKSSEEVFKFLESHKEWCFEENKLTLKRKFQQFSDCIAFFAEIARIAEQQNHHPEFYNNYNFCRLSIHTHDCNAITHKDFEFVEAVDSHQIIK